MGLQAVMAENRPHGMLTKEGTPRLGMPAWAPGVNVASMARLLTIVIALRNNRSGLERSLKLLCDAAASVRERLHVVIVDSNSSDAPIEVVRHYCSDLSIDFHPGYDSGIYQAWNKAIRVVPTPFLTFLGSGDTFVLEKLDLLMKVLESDTDFDLLFAKVKLKYTNGRELIAGKPFDGEEFGRWFSVAHSGAIYRTEVFRNYGNFDESYRITGDYEFLNRIKWFVKTSYLDEVLTEFPVDGVSSSSTRPLAEAYKVRRVHRTVSPLHNRWLYLRALGAYYVSRWRYGHGRPSRAK